MIRMGDPRAELETGKNDPPQDVREAPGPRRKGRPFRDAPVGGDFVFRHDNPDGKFQRPENRRRRSGPYPSRIPTISPTKCAALAIGPSQSVNMHISIQPIIMMTLDEGM